MKQHNITLSLALAAVFSSSVALAEAEVTGKIVHESAQFTESGTTIGATSAHGEDVFKTETSARIYIDGDIDEMSEGSTYHVELQAFTDGKGIGKYDGNESYTQRDALREAYVDTEYEDWSIRAGKQQVVWGTADGMKLLDMINPTDYSEMAQNQMEDSRIPVWMLNAEKELEDGGNFQVVVSQPRENVFAGLNRNIDTSTRSNGAVANGYAGLSYSGDVVSPGHDKGQAFILKGVDTISGEDNGFINIAPDLGTVASLFGRAFSTSSSSTAELGGLNVASHSNNATQGFLVGTFNTSTTLADFSSSFNTATSAGGGTAETFADLNFGNTAFWTGGAGGGASFSGQQALAGFAGMFGTNLHNTNSAVDSTFEYMDRTSFATFDSFVGATSQYVLDMPSDSEADLSLKYKNTLDSGLNYSLNYSNSYDKNPVIDVSWRDSSGNKLTVNRGSEFAVTGADAVTSVLTLSGGSVAGGYGGYNIDNNSGESAVLRFTQTLERSHNIGGSVDMALETDGLGPVVIRGEALYQKDVHQPVIDRGAMSIGDLPAALTMRKGDRFKYVLGADITALTNMMVSLQFIQDRNLDYIDSNIDFNGSACISSRTFTAENCGVYTLDFSSMHLSNGLKKAEKNKEFYSLFLSKPFGASGEHRWNNIFMFEENGGKWNRLDAEFSIDDDTQVTAEYNKYWGDANTQFGQLEKSSNMQIGLKYSF